MKIVFIAEPVYEGLLRHHIETHNENTKGTCRVPACWVNCFDLTIQQLAFSNLPDGVVHSLLN